MKIACVEAIAALAHAEASEIVAAAYGGAGAELRRRSTSSRGPSIRA